MAKSYRTKFFMSLTAGCLLSVATLAQAQSVPLGQPVQECTTRYNRALRQYETTCRMQNTVNFGAVFQTPEFKEYHKRLRAELDAMTPEEKERMRCNMNDMMVGEEGYRRCQRLKAGLKP